MNAEAKVAIGVNLINMCELPSLDLDTSVDVVVSCLYVLHHSMNSCTHPGFLNLI